MFSIDANGVLRVAVAACSSGQREALAVANGKLCAEGIVRVMLEAGTDVLQALAARRHAVRPCVALQTHEHLVGGMHECHAEA